MLLGYARSLQDDQFLAEQRRLLRAAGCEVLYEDQAGERAPEWPARQAMLARLAPGDVLVVGRLDRLVRSGRELFDIAALLGRCGAGLRSLGEPWADTTGREGATVLAALAGLGQLERTLRGRRIQAGQQATRARGGRLGRPGKLDAARGAQARLLLAQGASVRAAAAQVGVHAATLYRALGSPGVPLRGLGEDPGYALARPVVQVAPAPSQPSSSSAPPVIGW